MREIVPSPGRLRGLVVLRGAQEKFRSPTASVFAVAAVLSGSRGCTEGGFSPRAGAGPDCAGLDAVVEFTFLDQIDRRDFGNSIALTEKGVGSMSDQNAPAYPLLPGQSLRPTNAMANCLYGSSMGDCASTAPGA
jgi:hypothetical protein